MQKDLFQNISFYIIDSTISPKRINVITNILNKHNAKYCLSSNTHPTSYEQYYIIVDPHISMEEFRKHVNASQIDCLTVLTIDYISECVRLKQTLPPQNYAWNLIKDKPNIPLLISALSSPPPSKRKHQEIECPKEIECCPKLLKDVGNNVEQIKINTLLRSAKAMDKRTTKFACQSNSENFNEHITEQLEKLYSCYEADGDKGRMMGYRKAIGAIKAYPQKIETAKQLEEIKGVGEKTKQKVNEIISTGSVDRIEYLEKDQKIQSVQLFTQIYGIGNQMATKLYQKGYRTVEDLRSNLTVLNKTQQLGLKYYEETNSKMPRTEVETIYNKVKQVCLSHLTKNEFTCECAGSYRRGRAMCGDADVIISKYDDIDILKFFNNIINSLEEDKLITDTYSKSENSQGSCTFIGICQSPLSQMHRRLDIKVYPKSQYAFALLYFTGSAYFNRSMRLLARKKGYSLSDHGISEVQKVNKEKVWTGESAMCFTEEDVFKFLKMEYKKPSERDI